MIQGGSGPSIVHLYARVSGEEQERAGTIENQLDRFRKWADLHGHAIGREFLDEAVSGGIPFKDRPAGAELLREAAAGQLAGLVCVVKLDRIGRTVRVVLEAVADLEGVGLRIASATEPFDTGTPWGRFALNILATFAEFERDSIAFRFREGSRRRAREGAYLGGKAPFGYVVEGKSIAPDSTWIPEAGESVAELAARIFREIGEKGASAYGLALRFNALGIPPPEVLAGRAQPGEGRQWHAAAIARIAGNPAYAGRWRYGRIGRGGVKRAAENVIERPCPALISEDLFEAAGAQLLRSRREAPHAGQRKYLLSGLILCGSCGAAYSAQTVTPDLADATANAQGVRYRCLTRATKARTGRSCDSPPISGAVEGLVWQRLLDWLAEPPEEAVEAARAEIGGERDESGDAQLEERIEALRRQLAAFAGQREAVTSLFRRSVISEPELLRQLAEIDGEASGVRGELRIAESERARGERSEEARARAAALRGDFAALASAADWDTRRYVVEALIDRVTIRQEGGEPIVEIAFRA